MEVSLYRRASAVSHRAFRMLQSDRLAELIKRNRDLLARAADLRSHTAETIIASQHLAAILREKGAERGWVRLEPVVVPLNRRTTP